MKNIFLKYTLIIFIILLATYLIALLYLYFNQKSFIFFPNKKTYDIKLNSNIEEITINTTDKEKLHAWWMNNNSNKTIIFFHGNAGNIYGRMDRMRLFDKFKVNALMIDYREYGMSSGKIKKENDLYLDAQAAYRFVVNDKKINPKI